MNWTTIIVAAIAAIPGIITALFVGRKVTHLHVAVNSRLTQLLERTSVASELQGRANQRQEDKDNGR